MKVFAALPLLLLVLAQEGLSTHLETCQCGEIREIVNSTVEKAVAGLEKRLNVTINSAISKINGNKDSIENLQNGLTSSLENLQNGLSDTMEHLLKPIKQQLDYHLPLYPEIENTQDDPATSCKALHNDYPHAPSGYYWITTSGSPVRVYCNMNITSCGDQTAGWMRVADIDMRNTSQVCPSGLSLISSPKRLCDVTSNTCVSNNFSVHGVQYSHVCGRIIGYQNRVPLAFYYSSRSINEKYVYGVSLTHGLNPYHHIWTFAGASDETNGNRYSFKCPCINPNLNPQPTIPSFVGNDYFCDTALSVYYNSVPRALQTDDPLWDGEGCGPTNTCCSFNTPPWFIKDLSSTTTDDIEMRVCRPGTDGSTPIEIVELYVQ